MDQLKMLPRGLGLVALLACSSDNPTDPAGEESSSASVLASQAAGSVPMKESYHAAGTASPDAGCGADQLLVTLAGGGNATHVGRYTLTQSHCLDPVTGAFSGSFTKTAANGDLLLGTYTGTAIPLRSDGCVLHFTLTALLRFTGGTGRFTGATGEAELLGTQETDVCRDGFPSRAAGDIEGTISRPGRAGR